MSSIYYDFQFRGYRGSPLIDSGLDSYLYSVRLYVSGIEDEEIGILLTIDAMQNLASKLHSKYDGTLFKHINDKTVYGQFSKVIETNRVPSLQAIGGSLLDDATQHIRESYGKGRFFISIILDTGVGFGYESSKKPV